MCTPTTNTCIRAQDKPSTLRTPTTNTRIHVQDKSSTLRTPTTNTHSISETHHTASSYPRANQNDCDPSIEDIQLDENYEFIIEEMEEEENYVQELIDNEETDDAIHVLQRVRNVNKP